MPKKHNISINIFTSLRMGKGGKLSINGTIRFQVNHSDYIQGVSKTGTR